MDTFVTVTIVAAAALWAASRLFRRRPGSCEESCAGCTGAARAAGVDACAPAPPAPSLPSRNDAGR